MQQKYACVRYLHTRITVYHPCKIDLRYSKALHSCVTCRLLQLGLPCSAIHYGICQAVRLPPKPKSTSSKPPGLKPSPVHRPKPVSAPRPMSVPNPVSVPISKPVPAHVSRSVSVQTPNSVQSSKSVHDQGVQPGQLPVVVPVVPVERFPQQGVVVSSTNTWPKAVSRPVQPHVGSEPAPPIPGPKPAVSLPVSKPAQPLPSRHIQTIPGSKPAQIVPSSMPAQPSSTPAHSVPSSIPFQPGPKPAQPIHSYIPQPTPKPAQAIPSPIQARPKSAQSLPGVVPSQPTPSPKPAQPRPKSVPESHIPGPPHPDMTKPLVQPTGPSQARGGAGGQAARMVSHSVQPAPPVVMRSGSEASVTLPGGGVLVRTSSAGSPGSDMLARTSSGGEVRPHGDASPVRISSGGVGPHGPHGPHGYAPSARTSSGGGVVFPGDGQSVRSSSDSGLGPQGDGLSTKPSGQIGSSSPTKSSPVSPSKDWFPRIAGETTPKFSVNGTGIKYDTTDSAGAIKDGLPARRSPHEGAGVQRDERMCPQEGTDEPRDIKHIRISSQDSPTKETNITTSPAGSAGANKDYSLVRSSPQDDTNIPKDFNSVKMNPQDGSVAPKDLNHIRSSPLEVTTTPKDFSTVRPGQQDDAWGTPTLARTSPEDGTNTPKDFRSTPQEGTTTPRDIHLIRTSPQDSTGVGGSGEARQVILRTPVRVAVSRPASVPGLGPCPVPFPAEDEDIEVCPAFPVSPEDRLQATMPIRPQDNHHNHDALHPTEIRTQDNDLISPQHPPSASTLTTTPTTMTIISRSSPLSPTPTNPQSPPFPPPSSLSVISRGQDDPQSSLSSGESSLSGIPASLSVSSLSVGGSEAGGGGRIDAIPPFHFPMGKPPGSVGDEVGVMVQKATAEFAKLEENKACKEHMGQIVKACGFPFYWRSLLFRAAAGGEQEEYITLHSFSAMLHNLYSCCHDEASRFVKLVAKPGLLTLDFDDLMHLIQDVVDGHPGLSFLQDAPEFHSRYIHTVISRIFFCVNRSWTGRLSVTELRRSNFLRILSLLEDEEDINQITEYFSYEHFYVIYCKFWELDKDHDLFIDRDDLTRHNDHALNSRLIDRIFSGAVTRGQDMEDGRMPYKEFVWFLLAEEDKKHPTSIEYWFRCMDLDGDGVISMYEMEYFYEEQMLKMEALGIEKLPFEDCLCQMFDLVRPRVEERITLSDLKNCRMADIFFDTFLNLDKFLEHEQRDPFAAAREVDAMGREMSDWDRYAAEEYDILVAEEGLNEPEEIHFDEDLELEDDENLEEHVKRLMEPVQCNSTPLLHPPSNDTIFEVTNTDTGF